MSADSSERGKEVNFVSDEDFELEAIKAISSGLGVDHPSFFQHNCTLLINACERGNLNVVRQLLGAGAHLEAQNTYYKQTPLHRAASSGHLEVVKYLLSKGANIEAIDCMGNSVLYNSVSNYHLDVVKYLIEKKAKVSFINDSGNTLLHAVQGGCNKIVDLLINHGVDPNVQNHAGETALMLSCAYYDRRGTFSQLLYRGADPTVIDKSGQTLFLHIMRAQDSEMLSKALLLGNQNIDLADIRGNTPLSLAIEDKQASCVKLLLKAGAKISEKEWALKNNSRGEIPHLLESYFDRQATETLKESLHNNSNSNAKNIETSTSGNDSTATNSTATTSDHNENNDNNNEDDDDDLVLVDISEGLEGLECAAQGDENGQVKKTGDSQEQATIEESESLDSENYIFVESGEGQDEGEGEGGEEGEGAMK